MASSKFEQGFEIGLKWSQEHFDPVDGYGSNLREWYSLLAQWDAGFAEGCLTGCSKVLNKHFPNAKTIYSTKEGYKALY